MPSGGSVATCRRSASTNINSAILASVDSAPGTGEPDTFTPTRSSWRHSAVAVSSPSRMRNMRGNASSRGLHKLRLQAT